MGMLGHMAGKQVHTNLNYLRCPKCYKPLTTNPWACWHSCEPKPKPRLVN